MDITCQQGRGKSFDANPLVARRNIRVECLGIVRNIFSNEQPTAKRME